MGYHTLYWGRYDNDGANYWHDYYVFDRRNVLEFQHDYYGQYCVGGGYGEAGGCQRSVLESNGVYFSTMCLSGAYVECGHRW